jgi:hypothetical protein
MSERILVRVPNGDVPSGLFCGPDGRGALRLNLIDAANLGDVWIVPPRDGSGDLCLRCSTAAAAAIIECSGGHASITGIVMS